MSAASRGAARERQRRKLLEADGWLVVRPGGSKGSADLWAARDGMLILEQIKSDRAGPFAHFGPADRERLLADAKKAGALACLVWWPPDGKGPRELWPVDWPTWP